MKLPQAAIGSLLTIACCGIFLGARSPTFAGEQQTPIPLPKQVAAKEGFVEVSGARLWYWDTGGDGEVVVLLHPAAGSGLIWGYQQPVLAKAGYRVIGYSRKGHAKSPITRVDELRSDVDDLHDLALALKLKKFHAVGSAAGGGIVMQYAVKHPEMLASLTLASSLGSARDEAYWRQIAAARPANFQELPLEERELGPQYRAADPSRPRRWLQLANTSREGSTPRSSPADATVVTWEKLSATKIPTLFIGGDADSFLPPAMLKYGHEHVAGSQMQIIDAAGHSAYWEQPAAFNRAVLAFLAEKPTAKTH